MANNTINQNVNQAIMDFSTIKQAIINKGVSVPSGTPTSQYANKISSIQSGADVSGVTATAADVDTGKVFVNSIGVEVTGTSTYKADYTALNTIVGQTTATAEDVAQGKVFVNSSGVQTTGTASGGGNQDLIDLIERDLVSFTVPNTTTKIGYAAFYRSTELKNITLPNGILQIEGTAFRDCTNLETINLPEGLTSIGLRAFQNCPKLTSIVFPSSLVAIDGAVYQDCTALTTVTFLSTPTTIGGITNSTFSGCTNLTTIRVPWSGGEVEGAPWGATNATIVYNYTP